MKEELKSNRILALYDALMTGRPVNRLDWAAKYGICERSVRRDIDTIQQYLEERNQKSRKKTYIVYHRKSSCHQALDRENPHLSLAEFQKMTEALLQSHSHTELEKQSLVDRIILGMLDPEDIPAADRWVKEQLDDRKKQ